MSIPYEKNYVCPLSMKNDGQTVTPKTGITPLSTTLSGKHPSILGNEQYSFRRSECHYPVVQKNS